MYRINPWLQPPTVEQTTKKQQSAVTWLDPGAHAAAAFGIARSPHWHQVAQQHLARQPDCMCCKRNAQTPGVVQVHHIFPFHYCVALGRPDLELDDRNLITLCSKSHNGTGENHHLWIGHLDNFQSSNLYVVRDAEKAFFGMTTEDIKSDKLWLRHWRRRLKPLELMSANDKEALLAVMNRRIPGSSRADTMRTLADGPAFAPDVSQP